MDGELHPGPVLEGAHQRLAVELELVRQENLDRLLELERLVRLLAQDLATVTLLLGHQHLPTVAALVVGLENPALGQKEGDLMPKFGVAARVLEGLAQPNQHI